MPTRDLVQPPRPRPAAVSLVNSAVTPDQQAEVGPVGGRWQQGFRFTPEPCGNGWVEDPCAPEPRDTPARGTQVEGEPYALVTPDRCTATGFQQADYVGRAQRLMLRRQSALIAAELWSGELAAAAGWPNQTLVGTGDPEDTPDELTNGPASAVVALACLEQYLAACGLGDRGMIHMTPQLASHITSVAPGALRREGGLLLTVLDTIVVPDAGYPGSGPGGVPAGASQWAYATGLVQIEMSEVMVLPGELAQALDRSTNTVEYFAQRLAAHAWDGCCHGAAEVDLGVCLIGGAS